MKKVALACSGVVLAGSFVAVVTPADATTTTDTCSGLTTQSLSVTRSATAPTTMLLGGAPHDVNLTSVVDMPASLVGSLSTVSGSGTSTGTIKAPDGATLPVGGAAASVVGTPLNSGDVSVPVTPDAATSFSPDQVGDYQVLAGQVTVTLTGLVDTLACTAPGGTVVDTIRVLSPSRTSVTVGSTTIAYGQSDRGTATVSTTLSPLPAGLGDPSGTVRFTAGGKAVSGTLSSGRTSVRLPRLAAGHTYTVTGTYLPDAGSLYAGSKAATAVKVVKDATRTAVKAPSIRRHHREVATVRVGSAHGAMVRGKVRAVLEKGTRVLRTRTVSLRRGVATVGFGRLARRGRNYAVVAKYLGSGNFKVSRGKDGFVVK